MFLEVITHFDEFTEDQYDFHNYCLRKVTLRAYVDLIRMEDCLYCHPAYGAAAEAAIDAYVQLHVEDRPGEQRRAVEAALAGLSVEAAKKARDRQAKEAAKVVKAKAAELEKRRQAHNSKRNSGKFDDVRPCLALTGNCVPSSNCNTTP
jgi:N-alpha-acetyltransferase 15/16, NatA auxiliary subunit